MAGKRRTYAGAALTSRAETSLTPAPAIRTALPAGVTRAASRQRRQARAAPTGATEGAAEDAAEARERHVVSPFSTAGFVTGLHVA